MIFDRGPNGESKLFQQIVLEKLVSHIQKILININLLSYTEIKSKWIIDLAIKHKAIILLEENKRKNRYVLRLGEEFLEMAPKSLSIKEKVEKLDFIKIKNIQSAKGTVKTMKRQATAWELKYLQITFQQKASI